MLAFMSSAIECADVCVCLRFMNVAACMCMRVCFWHSLSYYEPHQIYVSTSNSSGVIYLVSHTTSRDDITPHSQFHKFIYVVPLSSSYFSDACLLARIHVQRLSYHVNEQRQLHCYCFRLTFFIYLFILTSFSGSLTLQHLYCLIHECMHAGGDVCAAVNQRVNLNYATLANRSSNSECDLVWYCHSYKNKVHTERHTRHPFKRCTLCCGFHSVWIVGNNI